MMRSQSGITDSQSVISDATHIEGLADFDEHSELF